MSAADIARLNDAHRRVLLVTRHAGLTTITRGVAALPADTVARIMGAVSTFDSFGRGNDPHGEHDFGRVVVDDVAAFFKFDYFEDDTCTSGAENGRACYRVLTIMLAEEY